MENVNYKAFMAKVNSGELSIEKEIYQKDFDPINGSTEAIKFVIYKDNEGNMFFARHYDYNSGGEDPFEFNIVTIMDQQDLEADMGWLEYMATNENDQAAAQALIDMQEYAIREEMRYDYAQTHMSDIIEPWETEPTLPTDPIDEPVETKPTDPIDEPGYEPIIDDPEVTLPVEPTDPVDPIDWPIWPCPVDPILPILPVDPIDEPTVACDDEEHTIEDPVFIDPIEQDCM